MDLDLPTVPKFLTKLWDLVNNPVYNDLICWDVSGKSFHVVDQVRFAREILPSFFKHNQMNSFVRQLNMYGFRKVNPCIETSMTDGREEVTFAHKYFLHGQRHLLENIKRKTSQNQTGQPNPRHDISEIYEEVSNMKTQLDSMTDTLENLRVENECLWKEVVNLRQKHARQQQVVSKLVQFFISLVNKDHNHGSLKRKFNLMIKGPNEEDSVPTASNAVAQGGSNPLTSLSTLKQTSNALGLKSLTGKGKPTLVYLTKNPAEENKSLVAKVGEPRILNIQKNLSPEFPIKALEPLSVTLPQPQSISLSDLIEEPELYGGDFDLFRKIGLPSNDGSSLKELMMKNDSRNILRDFDKEEFSRNQNNFQNNLDTILSVFDANQQIDLSDASLLALQDDSDVSPTKKLKSDDNSHDLTVMHYNPEDHTFTDSLISEFSGEDGLYTRQDDNDNEAYAPLPYDDFL